MDYLSGYVSSRELSISRTPAGHYDASTHRRAFTFSCSRWRKDTQNKHGGKWAFQFKDQRGVLIDDLWLHVMLAAIGETLESDKDKEIMGVVVNVRKAFYRIGLWTKTTGGGKGTLKEAALMESGKNFKEVLKLGDKEVVEFSGYTESAHAGQSRAKAKHVV